MAKTGITPTRNENFSEWYQNVIVAADLAESSPSRGCMTIKPYGFAIWELIRDEMDKRIKAHDVQNAYFPLLIPMSFMTKEAEHVAGFAKECAVVTHYRLHNNDGIIEPDPEAKLAEPYIIRPTSETIIGEAMSRWVQSHRDLPLKLNQWANVMRWEMRTRIFLRTSEFLWQEGHCVFASAEDAEKDALEMLHTYNEFSDNILAISSVVGPKTPDDKFAGADVTYAIEHIMQDGKALQSGTSHNLGQHFAKSFDIKFLNKNGELEYGYTTSWGTTTRLIGSVIMSHSDDDGLVLPPKIAPYQVVIIPILKNEELTDKIMSYSKNVCDRLAQIGIRVKLDDSDSQTSDKMWKWIKKGVPVRIEVGEREMSENKICLTRRDLGKSSKEIIEISDLENHIQYTLDKMQSDMLECSRERNKKMIHEVSSLEEIDKALQNGVIGFFKILYKNAQGPKFDELKERYKVAYHCLDMQNPEFVYIAKSY